MKQLIFIFAILLNVAAAEAQIIKYIRTYSNIESIKSKNRKGGVSTQKIDEKGRVIESNSYFKRKQYGTESYQYNDRNDMIYNIYANNFGTPKQVYDTVKYEYTYIGNKIATQKRIFKDGDSKVHQLLKNQGDSILTYQVNEYYMRNNKSPFISTLELTYQKDLLVKEVETDDKGKSTITNFEYYDNGQLKHRVIKRSPDDSGLVGMYVGGPGSDDEYYKYTYDSDGRVKKYYMIIGDKTYKLATYKYQVKKLMPTK